MSGMTAKKIAATVTCAGAARGVLTTWSDIIADYRDRYADSRAQERQYFEKLTLPEAIKQASMCYTHEKKRHPHQRRLKQANLQTFCQILLDKKKSLAACKSFDSLHQLVSNPKSSGIGELTNYDVAHRIGIKLGLSPQRVYLHAGTRRGMNSIPNRGPQEWRGCRTVELQDLPEPLQRVTAEEAEDILCIYKDRFSTLRS